jgi:hypothetical protein
MIVIFAEYNYNYQFEENEIGRVRKMNWEKTNAYRLLVGMPEMEATRKTK